MCKLLTNLGPIAKAIVALLGSGVATGVAVATPSPWAPVIGGIGALVTGALTWLIPNTEPEPD